MSFKVYTYQDPYLLNKTTIWEEVKSIPHFCSSSVMAQGMWNLYHNDFDSFFWSMDNLVAIVYGNWINNVERKIAQYITVSKRLKQWREKDSKEKNRIELFDALEHNKGQLIDALRMFVELDIDDHSLHDSKANSEQRAFISLYREIRSGVGELASAFCLDDESELSNTNTIFSSLLSQSLIDEDNKLEEQKNTAYNNEGQIEAREARIARIRSLQEKDKPFDRLIIHGIHQFSPLQLRLISKLDEAGIEIIFLFNYLPKHSHIYATWHHLYGLLDVPIVMTEQISGPEELMPKRKYPESYQLSKAFSELLEAKPEVNVKMRRNWMESIEKVDFVEFQNTTEMADFVSSHIDEIVASNASIDKIDEKVYSASKEADDLLKIYYPDYSGGRHFLHYPIGQFFMGLYQLWNEEKLAINFDYEIIRECAAAGIIGRYPAQRILELLELMRSLFVDIQTYNDVISRLKNYIQVYSELTKKTRRDQLGIFLSYISLYNESCVSIDDAKTILSFIEDLQSIAYHLFTENGKPIRHFTSHFQRLESFMKDNLLNLVTGEEHDLVISLLQRFDTHIVRTDLDGTIDDLRTGLYYYLRQSQIENPDWVVRNFVQIEGDILRSKKQSEQVNPPTYHFAGLSDSLLTQRVDDLLPWPLNDYFIQTVYSPNALIFQMYYLSKCEFSEFIRYALFYGLHFNFCPVRLSYIRFLEDREEKMYFPFRLLHAQAHPYQKEIKSQKYIQSGNASNISSLFAPTSHGMADFLLCPLKYYFDFCTNNGIIFKTPFSINRFYVNLLIYAAWNRWQNTKVQLDNIVKTIHEQQKQMDVYFPFLRDVNDKTDLANSAIKYVQEMLVSNNRMQKYDQNHMIVKMLFKSGYYEAEREKRHPYPAFENIIYKSDTQRQYKLYNAMNNNLQPDLKKAVMEYLKSADLKPNIGKWCANCPSREACLETYRHEISQTEE